MQYIKTFVKSSRFLFALSVFVFLFACAPGVTHALTLTPPRVEISGDPGQTVTTKMTVINDLPAPGTYYSSYANFEASGDSGTPQLMEATDDLGTWITAPQSVFLAGRGSQEVTLSIAIPKNAAPGGHFAAIFWGTQLNDKKTNQVGIGAKTGMLILLRVNGDIPEAGGIAQFDTLGSKHLFTALPIGFSFRFQNGGGDRIKPVGEVLIKDMLYITAKHIDGNPVDGNVLPVSARKFTTVWTGRDGENGVVPTGFFAAANYEFHNFGFGRYGAHLNLSYGTKGQVAKAVVHFWVFPWQLTIIVLVAFIILFFITKTAVYHYNKWVISKAEEMLEEKEEQEEEEAEKKGEAPSFHHHFHGDKGHNH